MFDSWATKICVNRSFVLMKELLEDRNDTSSAVQADFDLPYSSVTIQLVGSGSFPIGLKKLD